MKWEFLKYEIRKKHKINLEHKLKDLENNLPSKENRKLYNLRDYL